MRSPFIAISLFAANMVTAAPTSPKLGTDTFLPKGTDMDMNRVAGLPRDLLKNMESGGAGLTSFASKSSGGSAPAPGMNIFTAASQSSADPITGMEKTVQVVDGHSSTSQNNEQALEDAATSEGREPDHHNHEPKSPNVPTFPLHSADSSKAFATPKEASVAHDPATVASSQGDQTTGQADKAADQAASTAGGAADGSVPPGPGKTAANTAKGAADSTTGTTKSTTDKAVDTADKTADEATNGASSEAANKGAGSTSSKGAGSKTNKGSGKSSKV